MDTGDLIELRNANLNSELWTSPTEPPFEATAAGMLPIGHGGEVGVGVG